MIAGIQKVTLSKSDPKASAAEVGAIVRTFSSTYLEMVVDKPEAAVEFIGMLLAQMTGMAAGVLGVDAATHLLDTLSAGIAKAAPSELRARRH